jgi:N-acetyl-anhydromuramyl-L-alanine amidase AmpD
MAQSPEYPDLLWMPPRSWTNADRTAVQLVVIHTTEGSAHARSAEDGAAYDQRRTDGTSTHYFHDSDSTIQCVRTADRAHTARSQGNRRGIHHELCTRAGRADWSDAYHQAMLRRAAKQAARDAEKWGIPIRHLTVAQVAAGEKGFCGHYDITRAFPADGGTHTDPGANFPWSTFLDLVRAELEDDMPLTAADGKTVWQADVIPNPAFRADAATNKETTASYAVGDIWRRVGGIEQTLTALTARVAQLAGADLVDEAAIVSGVLSELTPAAIAAAIPADIAEQVARELADRLAA